MTEPAPPPDVRVAIVVDPTLPPGLLANTVSAIGIGLGAAVPELGARRPADRTGRAVDISSVVPVPVLQASPDVLVALLLRASDAPEKGAVVPFCEFARSRHDVTDYIVEFARRDLAEQTVQGLGLAGRRKWVASLTGSLALLR